MDEIRDVRIAPEKPEQQRKKQQYRALVNLSYQDPTERRRKGRPPGEKTVAAGEILPEDFPQSAITSFLALVPPAIERAEAEQERVLAAAAAAAAVNDEDGGDADQGA